MEIMEMEVTEAENNTNTNPITTSRKTQDSQVQITATNAEISRRITSFIERKRHEVNQHNLREFCGVLDPDIEIDGCARTNAVFVPKTAEGTHYKVSHVYNNIGPQTANIKEEGDRSCLTHKDGDKSVNQRLQTIESHLNLKESTSRADVHSRLRKLEDKILYLEGVSPEYFNKKNVLEFATRQSDEQSLYRDDGQTSEDLSLEEIDQRMLHLTNILKEKSKHPT